MKMQAIDQRLLALAGFAAILFGQTALAAADSTAWERRQLHQPSQQLLEVEQRGRVTIYDGLHESDVERAMDEQFDRIGRMMLIRTQYLLADGSDSGSGSGSNSGSDSGDCD
jgi:hypothetical protein